jgi:hypothetical protein
MNTVYKKYEDENHWCVECGRSYIFTALEKEFYDKKGYDNYPNRCEECREKKNGKPALKLYEGICCKCGGRAILSFKPINPETVKCEV